MNTALSSAIHKPVPQCDPPLLARDMLPDMYDLPSEDPEEPGVPDMFHLYQPQLLSETFDPPEYPLERLCTASDLNLYYDVRHPTWYKRPDWYAVLDVPRLYAEQELRLSYVIWQEGVTPFLVVELLSPGTEKEDLGQTLRLIDAPPTKWQVYEQILRVPYYVIFSRYTRECQVYVLNGTRYRKADIRDNRLWLPEIRLGVGLWDGVYQGVAHTWLRFYREDGQWIPTQAEARAQEAQRAEQEKRRAEQENRRAEQEKQRADKLAAKLRELGIDPESL